MKVWYKRRWQDRWHLRFVHWLYILRHPLMYYWYIDLKEDDDFRGGRTIQTSLVLGGWS